MYYQKKNNNNKKKTHKDIRYILIYFSKNIKFINDKSFLPFINFIFIALPQDLSTL